MTKHRLLTLILTTTLAALMLSAAPREKKNILSLKNSITDDDIVFPESFDTDVHKMMTNWYLQNYAVLDAGTETFFLTHGHLWNEFRLPPIGMGTVLVHGHTHIPEQKKLKCGLTIFNPGSVALPKGGSSRSFGYFDGQRLCHVAI